MIDPILEARIFLIDDEPVNLRLLERFLARAQFARIDAFSDPLAALGALEATPPDLVLLDLHMPRMDGFALLRAIGERLPPEEMLPLVVLTGDTDRAARSRALSSGASDFLVKPLDGEEVVLRVRNHLRTRRLHQQVRAHNQELHRQVASTSHALHVLEDEWAAVAASLSRLTAQGTAEATAAAIREELSTLPDLDGSALIAFGAAGTTLPLGLGFSAGGPLAVDLPIPDDWSRTLRSRAALGAWIEPWPAVGQRDGSPGLSAGGISAVACIPLRDGPALLGLLLAGVSGPDGTARLARRLPTLEAFAALASALLGRDLLGRQRQEATWSAIRRSITETDFRPVFQAIVSLSKGRVVGHEALTRFGDGTPPDRRFADAAAVGLGDALESATLAASIAGAEILPTGVFLSLNVSPQLVIEGDGLGALLATAGAPVVLEITEHVPIEDYRRLREAIGRLGATIRFAVDDAGSGFASFRHILELRPDFVKLDIGLVRDIDRDPARQAFVAAMVYFALRTGCLLIAEGIETEPERSMLLELGVELGQGYLIGVPRALA